MKKTIFILILIFKIGISNGQTKSGIVSYRIIFQKDSTLLKKSDRLSQLYDKAVKSSDKIYQELSFNQKISKYSIIDLIADDDLKMAIAWCNCNKIYFEDIENKSIIFNNTNDASGIFKENEFIIRDSLKINWEITSESKNIENFKCYKATQIIKYKNLKGEFSKTVVAWFTPEIPFSFGPKGYGGLPGLILELHDKNIIYGASKINLSNEVKSIDLPKKGKIIKNEDFEKILKDRNQERINTIENNKN